MQYSNSQGAQVGQIPDLCPEAAHGLDARVTAANPLPRRQ